MIPFLEELASKLYEAKQLQSSTTLIFPNRRAVLYFKKYLSALLNKPAFAPSFLTIEDFLSLQSTLQVPDKLELIHRLHKAYQQIIGKEEPFDQFYFWGEMLLRDFEEIDKYCINAHQLFKDLSHQKEIDSSFDFLTEDQLEFLKSFWDNFDETLSLNKTKFLQLWIKLPAIYDLFKKQLKESGLAYEGMLQREVTDSPKEGIDSTTKIIFIGFNALTSVEEKVISYFVTNQNAQVHWDTDSYYVNNNTQEAGLFFREYQQHSTLQKTFTDIPSNLTNKKSIEVIGAPQHVGQTKVMAQILEEQLKKGIKPEETLIVLPDEKLMLPVLHSTSTLVDKLNVTMGFSLSSTPLFNLIELLIELQITIRSGEFNHRQVLTILGHPYIVSADPKSANEKRKIINKQNKIYISPEWLHTDSVLHQLIFIPVFFSEGSKLLLEYLRKIIVYTGSLKSITDFDKEYCFHFLKLINRLEEVIGDERTNNDSPIKEKDAIRNQLKSFLKLFRQVARVQKIPFTGEPMKGLQIMGVLETRNIDFKNVFILSINEGALPSGSGKGSYIPTNIRRAYAMPTPEHQDAIYAYLFYRVLQRSENIFLFYNTETDILGQGEMSRYLQQLLFESGLDIKRNTLHNQIQPHAIKPIEIQKDQTVMNKLSVYQTGHPASKAFYPTQIIDYLECKLRFYLKHILQIKEAIEVEDEMDARVLGSFVHKVMQFFYEDLQLKIGHKPVDEITLKEMGKKIPHLIDRTFIETYKLEPNKPVDYDGQRLVIKEIVQQFAERIVKKDIEYAPFFIEGIERSGLIHELVLSNSKKIQLKGIVDRIDRKENLIRVIDYKTGKDTVEIRNNVDSLFSIEGEQNKAAFQTLFYAMLYKSNNPSNQNNINAGLFNRSTLFGDDEFGLTLNKVKLKSVDSLIPEFERSLKTLFEEIYNPKTLFDQTKKLTNCKNCSFQTICYK